MSFTGDDPPWRDRITCFLVMLALVALGYEQVASSFFLADDFHYLDIISKSDHWYRATGIPDGWIFFRPLTGISFWCNYLVAGLEPWIYHCTSLLFHAINAYLVASLAWQLSGHRLGSVLAGASFALFPLHPEAVTWIAGRADVLCATGTLLCLIGWLEFLCTARWGRGLTKALLGFVFALLTKDSAMVLPLLLLFLALVVQGCRWRIRGLGLAVVGLLLLGYLLLRFAALGGFGGMPGPGAGANLQINLPNAIRYTWDSLCSMALPGIARPPAICALLVLGWIVLIHGALGPCLARAWPLAVCFLILLAPVANLASLDRVDGLGSRLLYMPAMIFCLGLAVLLGTSLARTGIRGQLVPVLCLLLCYLVGLRQSNRVWREAADQSWSILVQLRQVVAKRSIKTVFVYRLPDRHRGAYLYRNGFGVAIRLFVDKGIEFPIHGRLSQKDWEKYAKLWRRDSSQYPGMLLLSWDPRTKILSEP